METLRCVLIIPVIIVLTLDIGYLLRYKYFQKDDEGQVHNREKRSGLSDLNTNTTKNKNSTSTSQTPKRFRLSIELNLTHPHALDLIKNLLSNTLFPVNISESLQLGSTNITTVCSPTNNSYWCTCEGQYRWSCDQCKKYGQCNAITNEQTCGCIRARPSDGSHCNYNLDPCLQSTTHTPTTNSTSESTMKSTTRDNSLNSTVTSVVSTPSTGPSRSSTSESTMKSTTRDNGLNSTVTSVGSTPSTGPSRSSTSESTMKSTTRDNGLNSTVTSVGSTPSTGSSRTLDMTITLDLDFNSSNLTELNGTLSTLLDRAYKNIAGFKSASVALFRPGSVILDYNVLTTEFNANEIKSANTAFEMLVSLNEITSEDVTYTDTVVKLACEIPEGIGTVDRSRSEWRHGLISTSDQDISRWKTGFVNNVWFLNISSVTLSDHGNYECVHKSDSIHFVKEGTVRVREAPNVRIDAHRSFQCEDGQSQVIKCCVQMFYDVQWISGPTPVPDESNCISRSLDISCDQEEERSLTCQVKNPSTYEAKTSIRIFKIDFICDDEVFGQGVVGDLAEVTCDQGFMGFKEAKCETTGWKVVEDKCLLSKIRNLLIISRDLEEEDVPMFVKNVTQVVEEELDKIVESPASIGAIVDILDAITNVSKVIDMDVAEDILLTADAIIGEDSKESWDFLNNNNISLNTSSIFLASMENLSNKLNGTFFFLSQRIAVSRTTFDHSFFADLNSTVVIDIPFSNISDVFITTISFPTLLYVMPTRNSSVFTASNQSDEHVINAAVVLITLNASVPNVTLEYSKLNQSLTLNPQCVFWNYTLVEDLGAWDDEGCTLVSNNDTVVCSCDHLTSFSILMAIDIPRSIRVLLDVITYVGVGISIASLVICIIIESYVWKQLTNNVTGFMKHFSLINVAMSLLIANICFIIGASIAKNPKENPGENFLVPIGPCSTATFFMHFFYLAVFFWMLVLGVLLLFKTTMVFCHLSKTIILVTGLTIGYLCPLIIAVITVAVTAPNGGYIRKDLACWLNWIQTKALLALVIPALTIVLFNTIVIIVVVAVLCRSTGRVSANERSTVLVVIRLVAILTPLFGLTWGLGVGTMISATNEGIHIAFAFFNSLQGFFILVFGSLLDSKVREVLSTAGRGSNTTRSNPTGSTTAGISSSSNFNIGNPLRQRRDVYRVADPVNSGSSGATESFINT